MILITSLKRIVLFFEQFFKDVQAISHAINFASIFELKLERTSYLITGMSFFS